MPPKAGVSVHRLVNEDMDDDSELARRLFPASPGSASLASTAPTQESRPSALASTAHTQESRPSALTAALSAGAASDRRHASLILFVSAFSLLKSYRPEAVVTKFFAAARKTRVCKDWSVFPELKELEASAPCVALRRVIEEGVQMTLPGFDAETSAVFLTGVRQIVRETGSFV